MRSARIHSRASCVAATSYAGLDGRGLGLRHWCVERFYIAFNRFDAYLVLHRLQQAGIPAHVFNEHMQSIVGDVPPDVAQPQVWLERPPDLPRPEALLRALLLRRPNNR